MTKSNPNSQQIDESDNWKYLSIQGMFEGHSIPLGSLSAF